MIRSISTLLLILQPAAAFAADKCGGARLAEGSAAILVLLEQNGSEAPVATHVSVDIAGLDTKFRFFGAYEAASDGLVTPTQFFVSSSATVALAEPHRETIRWRRDDTDWHTLPLAYYGDGRGNFSFQVAQKGPNKGTTYHTEYLEDLKRGGQFTVTRLSESGEALVTGTVQYPGQADINALYKRAKAKAVATLKPCKPAMHVVPAS